MSNLLVEVSVRAICPILPLMLACSAQAEPARLDERYRLNIAQKHVSQAQLQVGSRWEWQRRPLHCRVGVSLQAEQIEATLWGVRGDVRFLANPESLRPLLPESLKTKWR